MSNHGRFPALQAAIVLAASLTFIDLVPFTARAQPAPAVSSPPRTGRTGSGAERNRARADSLMVQAESLQLGPGAEEKYLVLARIYRRAALLRGDDSSAATSWRMAAWAYSASRNDGLALVMMKRAAETSARVGDVERSVNAFVDAALIAVAAGRSDQVPALLRRVDALLTSPLLPRERRIALRNRIRSEPSLAAALNGR